MVWRWQSSGAVDEAEALLMANPPRQYKRERPKLTLNKPAAGAAAGGGKAGKKRKGGPGADPATQKKAKADAHKDKKEQAKLVKLRQKLQVC